MKDIELYDLTRDQIEIMEILRKIAEKGGTISATELLNKANVKLDMSIPNDRGKLGKLLGEISHNEVKNGRPMLSSLVINANTNIPGQGFFEIAESLYSRKFKNIDDKIVFASEEMNKTHNFWSKRKNKR